MRFDEYIKLAEIWIDAIGFEGFYQVSSLGRVKRLPRLSRNSRNRNTFKKYGERILKLKGHRNKNKYVNAKLSVDGKITTIQLHRLVLNSFVSIPFDNAEVNHKNGNKHDNRLENLEWVTRKENINHVIENNLRNHCNGENHPKSKITKQEAVKIKELLYQGKYTYRQIAEKFNSSEKIVGDIKRGRTWKSNSRNVFHG